MLFGKLGGKKDNYPSFYLVLERDVEGLIIDLIVKLLNYS